MIYRADAMAGRTVLVTGASSGLGRSAAQMLAAAGTRIVATGRNVERLEALRASLQGEDHLVLPFELTGVDTGHDLIMAAHKLVGSLHGIFHAAGVAGLRATKTINDDHVRSLFASSIDTAFGIAKAVSKRDVLANGSAIVLMSSVAGVRGRSAMAAYSASRAAIGGLSRSLAAELAPRSIRVNEIVAGAVETEMHDQIVKGLDEAGINAYRNLHLLGFGRPEDIASTVVFLLSDASRWITGASIPVDGGYTAT